MADEREEHMLALMEEANDYLKFMAGAIQECQSEISRTQNTINEIWAEWTRVHTPTIDRSGPKEKLASTRSDVKRRQVVRRG